MPTTLIVDDDSAFGDICRALAARDDGYGFLFAGSDAEAIDLLRERDDLDLALVSIDSPGISGMDLFRRLEGRRIRVPRVALTHHQDVARIRSAMNAGAADFLVKPVAEDDLKGTIARVFGLCEERRRAWRNEAHLAALRREIELARGIQQRILPGAFPTDGGLDIAARLAPAEDMSGDFYDVFELPGGRLGIAIADVTGHGIPAAFLMAVVQTLLRAVAAVTPEPAAAVREVNEILCRHRIPSMLVSLFYGVLDRSRWRLSYANGGHPPPAHYAAAAGEVSLLRGGKGVILGAQEGLDYASDTLDLGPGDALLMYTDGVTEANAPAGMQFSVAGVQQLLKDHHGAGSQEVARRLLAAVDHHQDGRQRDDIAVMVVRRAPD